MIKFVTVLVSILALVLAKVDNDRVYCLNNAQDGSKELNFSYELSNGEIFTGQTVFLHQMFYRIDNASRFFYLLTDDNSTIQWVSLSNDEVQSPKTLQKSVFPVDREGNDTIRFSDDYHNFFLQFFDAGVALNIVPTSVQWDFENICFTGIDDGRNLFRCVIKSKNTKRTFTGETFYDINLPNPQKQRIHLSDSWLEDYVLAVEFTEHELNATKTFCKGISEIISIPSHIKEIISVQNIDPNALKSLVG